MRDLLYILCALLLLVLTYDYFSSLLVALIEDSFMRLMSCQL